MKLKTPFASLVIILYSFFTLHCLGQDVLWEKTMGGSQSEYLYDVKPTPDYGFILAGSSLSEDSGNKSDTGRGDLDYFLWKMDEAGRMEW